MDRSTLIIFGSPSRYYQGPGALDLIENICMELGGGGVVVVSDALILALLRPRLGRIANSALTFDLIEFSGEVTFEELERLAIECKKHRPAIIIAAGGGKGIDAGKSVARATGARLITLPTAASTDAPTSKAFAVYDREHRLVAVEQLARSPDAVVVDTELILKAPPALFSAGIGDAIVKQFEVDQCTRANGTSMFGARPTQAAAAFGQRCYEVLRRHGAQAMKDVRYHHLTDDVERVIEATVLMSGLAFENGGLSISHSMTRGLSAVRGAARALHGCQVAYGLLVQLVLENRGPEFMREMIQFFKDVELPTSLADLGLPDPTRDELQIIAELTAKAPHMKHFERPVSVDDLVSAIHAVEVG